MMNLASIDIGSNGARLLIKRFDPEAIREEDRIKKLMFIRIPLRLGKDVFTLGKVSKEREKMMLHMMKGFKQFMKLNDVEAFRACATSAMRDAENGKKVLKKIEKQTGIKLEIIKGQEEAQLLYNNLVEKTDSNEGSFAYIDVGGGSTEVSIIHDGVLAESYSYNMGTLRMLSGKVTAETEKLFKENLTRYAEQYGDIKIIGSGGNINKLNKLARHSKQDSKNLTLAELKRPRVLAAPLPPMTSTFSERRCLWVSSPSRTWRVRILFCFCRNCALSCRGEPHAAEPCSSPSRVLPCPEA